jgi:dihydroxyacetone kinase
VLQLEVVRLHVGNFVTSLDMAGCSITLLQLSHTPIASTQQAATELSDRLLLLLDAPANAPAWPHCTPILSAASKAPVPLPKAVEEDVLATTTSASSGAAMEVGEAGKKLELCLRAVCRGLQVAAPELNNYDQQVSRGLGCPCISLS